MNPKGHAFWRRAGALLAAVVLSVSVAYATQELPLPTTPPQAVDDTPVSHLPEPENFREQESPSSASESVAVSMAQPSPQPKERPPQPKPEGIEDTGYVILIGGVIWYAITMIGVTGGRRGIRRRD